jgi:hypothetical protein
LNSVWKTQPLKSVVDKRKINKCDALSISSPPFNIHVLRLSKEQHTTSSLSQKSSRSELRTELKNPFVPQKTILKFPIRTKLLKNLHNEKGREKKVRK